jgi:hypothetical protein
MRTGFWFDLLFTPGQRAGSLGLYGGATVTFQHVLRLRADFWHEIAYNYK